MPIGPVYRIGADGESDPTPARPMQEHAEQYGEQREKCQLDGDWPDEIALAENRERVGVILEHPVTQHRICRAAKQGHRADGRDDGRNTTDRDGRAIGSRQQSRAEPDRDRGPRYPLLRRRQPHRQKPARDDGGHRDVDFARDDQQCEQRDNRALGEVEVASESVSTFRKYGDRIEKTMNAAISTAASMVSHRMRLAAFVRASRMVRLNCRCRALRSTATEDHRAIDEHLPEHRDSDQGQTAANDSDEQASEHDARGCAGSTEIATPPIRQAAITESSNPSAMSV